MGWNSVEAANLTWQHLEEVEKILSASPFSLYYRYTSRKPVRCTEKIV
jgi:hypothetical protein